MVGCTVQGMLISRSRAMSYCEPCQSLTAAALNRRWRVPRGNFEGVTYTVSASVSIIEGGAQFFESKAHNVKVVRFLVNNEYLIILGVGSPPHPNKVL